VSADTSPVPTELWLCFAVNLLALAGICGLVLIRPTEFWYDESWYLSSVEPLRRLGPTSEFRRGLPGPAGPLHAWVHYLLEPLTGLEPLATRIANVLLFVLTVLAVGAAARVNGIRFAALRAPQLLGAPMLYASIGTALTEVPAMLAFAVHLALLLAALEHREKNPSLALGLGALAGLACGLAVAGRQTFLASVLALPLLGWRDRRSWWPLAACGFTALILPAFIFTAWGGLTPPKIAFVGAGLKPENVLVAFAYAGIVYAVYDFSWVPRRARLYAATMLAGVTANLVFGFIEHTPLSGTAARFLPEWSLPLYSRFFSGLFMGWGLVFMTELTATLWEPSTTQRYFAFAAMLILGSALKVTLPYAGRYMAGSVPLLLLIALNRAPDSSWKALRLGVATVIGLVSLNTAMDAARLDGPPDEELRQHPQAVRVLP